MYRNHVSLGSEAMNILTPKSYPKYAPQKCCGFIRSISDKTM